MSLERNTLGGAFETMSEIGLHPIKSLRCFFDGRKIEKIVVASVFVRDGEAPGVKSYRDNEGQKVIETSFDYEDSTRYTLYHDTHQAK